MIATILSDFKYLFPELILFCFGILVLIFDLVIPEKKKRAYALNFGTAGLVVTLMLVISQLSFPAKFAKVIFFGSFVIDAYAAFFKLIIVASSVFVLVLSREFREVKDSRIGEYTGLILFATLGMMLMAGANELLLIYLSIEFVSISFFVLVGFLRKDLKSGEGALKYFLIGAFSSGIFVYGISLMIAATGSTSLYGIQCFLAQNKLSPLFILSAILMLAGFGFKIAMVPFHMWAPEAYEGAPTPVTAFLSVASKLAGLAVLMRTFLVIAFGRADFLFVLAVLSAVTMTAGNLMALPQNNIKRLLAYSGIAHIGYLLIGFVGSGFFVSESSGLLGIKSVLIYSLAYLFMNIGVFALVIGIYNKIKSDDIRDYAGLSEKNPMLALVLVVFLISLAGIPPTAGFIGKFFVFMSAINAHYTWLAVIGIANSIIALYYYFRIVYQVYFVKTGIKEKIVLSKGVMFVAAVTFIFVLWICVFPAQFIDLADQSAKYFGLINGY